PRGDERERRDHVGGAAGVLHGRHHLRPRRRRRGGRARRGDRRRLPPGALRGGETAEHPDMMKPEEYDLAGFCVALAERRELVSGSRVQAGDAIVGLPSCGPHSNGFSLVRRLLERAGLGPADAPDGLGGATVADALLEPTRIYARPVAELCRTVDVRAMAHITGGGIPGNL